MLNDNGGAILVDGSLEKAILRLRKLWSKSIARDFRRHVFFLQEGERRRKRRAECIKKIQQRERQIEEFEQKFIKGRSQANHFRGGRGSQGHNAAAEARITGKTP